MSFKKSFLPVLLVLTAVILPLRAFEMPCRVYPVDSPVVLRIYPENQYDIARIQAMEIYGVRADSYGISGRQLTGIGHWEKQDFTVSTVDKKQVIEVRTVLKAEGLHTLRLQVRTASGSVQRLGIIEFYALKDDLFNREVLMGDLHTHSRKSTGRQEPERLAALALRAGYRFIAVTDRDPEEVRKLAADPVWQKCGFLLIPGEELSVDSRQVVVSAVNARTGIKKFGKNAVKPAMEKYLPVIKGSGLAERYHKAAALTMYLNYIIHREGGIAVMCHPFRSSNCRLETPPELRDFLLKYADFDGYEAINASAGLDGLVRGSAAAGGLTAAGITVPVPLGTQNTRNAAELNFGRHHTLVFAPENTPEQIFKALRERYAVVVSGVHGNLVMLGDARMVDYANFLRKNYFDRHYFLARRLGNSLIHKFNDAPKADKRLADDIVEFAGYLRDFKYRNEVSSGKTQPPGGGSGEAQQQQK